jgi:uncharacterized membrane protein YfcA
VVFLATLIRSALGFGEALFAVPLLALLLPLRVAAPLAVLLSITIAGIIVIQDWQKIHLRSTGWLLFATLFGIPVGLLLLTSSHQRMAKVARAGIQVHSKKAAAMKTMVVNFCLTVPPYNRKAGLGPAYRFLAEGVK